MYTLGAAKVGRINRMVWFSEPLPSVGDTVTLIDGTSAIVVSMTSKTVSTISDGVLKT